MSESKDNNKDYNLSLFQRNRYFYGKLMTVKDFDTEQNYMNEKRHLLNRMVNGAGIICGLGVEDVEVSIIDGNVRIRFKTGGAAIDGWGREIVVPIEDTPREIFVKEGSTKSNLTASLVSGERYYLYLEYNPREGEMVSSALENSSCEETCCPNRVIEDFEVTASIDAPDPWTVSCPTFAAETSEEGAKQKVKDWLQEQTAGFCEAPDEGKIFFLALNPGSTPVTVDETETNKYLTFVANNSAFSDLLACHLSDFGNPHKNLEGFKVGVDEDGIKVDHIDGYITIEKTDAITLDPDQGNHSITIGESHSARKDNPHEVKMSQLEDFNADDNKIINVKAPTDSKDTANKKYVDDNDTEIREYIDTQDAVMKDYVDTQDAGVRDYVDRKDAAMKDYVDTQDAGVRDYVDTKDAAMKDYVDTQDTGVRDYVDTKDAAMKDYVDTQDAGVRDYVDTKDAAMKDYVDTQDSGIREYIDEHVTETGNPHQTEHAQLLDIRGYSEPMDPPIPDDDVNYDEPNEDDVKDKHISNNDAKKWNEAAENPAGVGISTEGGMLTGSLYVKTTDLGAISGTAVETYGVMGLLTKDLDAGTDYREAGVIGISDIDGKHGVYARAPESNYALYVQGSALFTGPKTGYVVDVFKNGSGKILKTGDIVKLKGTAVSRFFGDGKKIPVPEVTLADKENDHCTIGIVDRKAIPDEIKKGKKGKAEDPSVVKDGEELYVVTLGAYFRCNADASEAPIEVGDLLTSSGKPGFAKKAVEPRLGSIIGKALEPLEKGTGAIAVFVNIQ